MRSAALVACLLLSAAPAGAAEWVRVESPNFIVFGETAEGRVREVAEEFERFRDALGRVIPGADTPAAVPTVVVVFGSTRAFAPYVPRYNGKPIPLGGYFFSSDDMNIVAFADGKRDEVLRTIFTSTCTWSSTTCRMACRSGSTKDWPSTTAPSWSTPRARARSSDGRFRRTSSS